MTSDTSKVWWVRWGLWWWSGFQKHYLVGLRVLGLEVEIRLRVLFNLWLCETNFRNFICLVVLVSHKCYDILVHILLTNRALCIQSLRNIILSHECAILELRLKNCFRFLFNFFLNFKLLILNILWLCIGIYFNVIWLNNFFFVSKKLSSKYCCQLRVMIEFTFTCC
jgi:hypothetical protein